MRFALRVRESLTPRANKNVALAVKLLVSNRSTPALAISLREVCNVRIGGKDRLTKGGDGDDGPSAELQAEDLGCRFSICDLLKRLQTILLNCTVHRCQQIAIKENAEPRPQRPIRRRAISNSNPWSQIVRVMLELTGQMLKIVADARVYRKAVGDCPMILDET